MLRFIQWLRRHFGAERKVEGGRVDWRRLADQSDERASRLAIDPPRPGRKTYAQRYAETSVMADSEIDPLIARREAAGKECGVLYRVKADRGY